MSNNHNNGHYYNFMPHPSYVRGSFPPQNPQYMFNPITAGMYLQQFPGQSGYLNPQMYFYGQQQQYQQVQIPRQYVQQYEMNPKVPQMPLVTQTAFSNTLSHVQYMPYPLESICASDNIISESHSMQASSQQLRERVQEQTNIQNTQSQTEQFHPNLSSSSFLNFKDNQNNGKDPPSRNHVFHVEHKVKEEKFTFVKKEEEQKLNEKVASQALMQNFNSQSNKCGKMPYKKLKMESDLNEKSIQQRLQTDNTKQGFNNQDNQLICQLQQKVKIEESCKQQCKQETREEEQEKGNGDKDVEEDYVCQDYANGENCNQSLINKESKVDYALSKQREKGQPKNESLGSSDKINQLRSNSEIKQNNQLNVICIERQDSQLKAKHSKKKKQDSSQQSALIGSNIEANQSRDNQSQEVEETNQEIQAFYDSLNEEHSKLIHQLLQIKVQNIFKNVITGLMKTVNTKFEKIYEYENPNNQSLTGNNLKTLNVIVIDKPSKEKKAFFSQKFNKYFNEKKLNNRSIEQIVKNTLYSKILREFLDNYSEDWLASSGLSNQEDNKVFLKFLRLSIEDHRYLFFLQRSQVMKLLNKQEIHQ